MPEEEVAKGGEEELIEEAKAESKPTPIPTDPLVDWKAKYDQAEANRKALQRNLEAERRKAANFETVLKKVDTLEENQAITLDYIDTLRTNQEIEPETPQEKPRRLDELKVKRAKEQEEREQTNAFWVAVNDAGLDANDPALMTEVVQTSRSPVEALSKLPSFIRKQSAKEAELTQKAREKLAEEQAREKAETDGLLEVDTGQPSASTAQWSAVLKAYGEGDISREQFEAEARRRNKKI